MRATAGTRIIPRGPVVTLRGGVKARKHTVRVSRQLEIAPDDERRVREVDQVFFISTHPLVIAPRPNVGPKPETVGPCQTLAWFSKCTTPRACIAFTTR